MEKKKDLNDGLMQAKGGRCGERSKEGGGVERVKKRGQQPNTS